MAKQNTEETRNALDDLNDSLTGIEQKVQNNQKIIMWSCVGAAIVACVVLFYVYGIRQPAIHAANDAIGKADMTLALGNDSIALEQYKQIAAGYGYDSGNRASLNAAILLYDKGEYQDAIKYLQDYSAKDKIIGASAKSLEGDCYVNLKEYDKAVKCFAQAAKISDNNPYYTPLFMMKEATVQRELKNYAAEANLYQQIQTLYPNYGQQMQIDIEKYLRRAQIQAGE